MTSPLCEIFMNKFNMDNIHIDSNIKNVNINTDNKVINDNKVGMDNDLTEEDKPYALKTFDLKINGYRYKKNIKKTSDDLDKLKKKQNEFVVIEKLSDMKNVDKK